MSYTQYFLDKIVPLAQADMKTSGILASLTIAQAICESAWGRSGLTKAGNNLFGIKGRYNENYGLYDTQEWNGSEYVTVKAEFRHYPSWKESIADHSSLFNTYDRYANLRGLKDYKLACRYVKEDGYATSPTYTQTLLDIIETYKLYEYDANDYQPAETPTADRQAGTWIVASGECLSTIADALGISWKDLASLNGLVSPYTIYPGQVLKTVGSVASVPATNTYTVKAGDCLSVIGSKLGIDWKTIAQVNGINSPYTIHIGQVLSLPGSTEKTYTVVSGDTLWDIAAKLYSDPTRYKDLMAKNGLASDVIQVGQVLKYD